MGRRWWVGPGLGRPGPSIFYMMGRGPARPVSFSEDEPRPAPANQIFRRWAVARPSPLHLKKLTARSGLAHHCFKFSARPGPAHHMAASPMRHGLYMGRPGNCVGRSLCRPVLKGACAHADVIF